VVGNSEATMILDSGWILGSQKQLQILRRFAPLDDNAA
jgi:hypothetical protein